MEKKRRDRINRSLDELKDLLAIHCDVSDTSSISIQTWNNSSSSSRKHDFKNWKKRKSWKCVLTLSNRAMDSWKQSNRTTNEVINNAALTWEHSFIACPKSAPRNDNVFWITYQLRTLVAISRIERIPPVIRSSVIGFIGVEAATVRNNNHWLTCLPLNVLQPPVHLPSMIIVNDRHRPPRLLSGDRGDMFSPFDFVLCFCSLSFCKRIHIWKKANNSCLVYPFVISEHLIFLAGVPHVNTFVFAQWPMEQLSEDVHDIIVVADCFKRPFPPAFLSSEWNGKQKYRIVKKPLDTTNGLSVILSNYRWSSLPLSMSVEC